MIRTRTYVYRWVKDVSLSENFASALNKRSPNILIYNLKKQFAYLLVTMIAMETAWLFLYTQNILVPSVKMNVSK